MSEKEILRELLGIVKDLSCCVGPDPILDAHGFIRNKLIEMHERLTILERYL